MQNRFYVVERLRRGRWEPVTDAERNGITAIFNSVESARWEQGLYDGWETRIRLATRREILDTLRLPRS